MNLLIKRGRVIDPANNVDDVLDILVEGCRIRGVAPNIQAKNFVIIDASNKVVVPGLIDIHVHFRQPGEEHKETIKTGSRAAAKGGFTTVVAEPNTLPPIDRGRRVGLVKKIAKQESIVHFETRACMTKNLEGKEPVDVREVKEAGAVGITDDGHPVANTQLMGKILNEARKCDIHVSPHCEESRLYRRRAQEKEPTDLILKYVVDPPYTAETRFIKRDIRCARDAHWPIYVSHVSLKTSVTEIAYAKSRRWPVKAEATPHHFSLIEKDVEKIGPNAVVNPPLRSQADVEAVRKGLADGTIDVIATDHAPHTPKEKSMEPFPFGVIGLETSLGLVLTELVNKKVLSINDAIAKMTINPGEVVGLQGGTLSVGARADITIIDLEKRWMVDVNEFESKSRNCPFNGWELTGQAFMTIVNGAVVMKDGEVRKFTYEDLIRPKKTPQLNLPLQNKR